MKPIADWLKRTQNERASNYGIYKDNIKIRSQLMDILIDYNKSINSGGDREFTSEDKIILSDIISKLVRLAANPDHFDSILDLESYVNLNIKHNSRYAFHQLPLEDSPCTMNTIA